MAQPWTEALANGVKINNAQIEQRETFDSVFVISIRRLHRLHRLTNIERREDPQITPVGFPEPTGQAQISAD